MSRALGNYGNRIDETHCFTKIGKGKDSNQISALQAPIRNPNQALSDL
jgi:hypothetical protein